MNARRWAAGAALSFALLAGPVGTMTAQGNGAMPGQAGFGHCVSEMASVPGGGGLAGHYQQHHPEAEEPLGQHLQTMRAGMMEGGSCPMDY